ncbi:NIL domain-containing protein [Thioalkalivibrio sp.]|uniref:NIL domain-containing protein n=1 Tax=Thioalkalivibrio sp. TaxID=2093813 RepID=UPI003976096B
MSTTTRKLYLYFPKSETEKPIVYHMVKDYDLVINIFRAKVTPEEEGYLVLDVTGEEANIDKALEFLDEFDVEINSAGKRGFRWESEVCTHCGNCLPHCPTAALQIADPRTREIQFVEEQCIECLACMPNCPYGACRSVF